MARTPKVVEDRREQIIDAAMRIFSQKGFSRATNKDIAREAGITPGLIYHYFESKEALLKALVEARSPVQMLRDLPTPMLAMPPESFLPYLVRQVLLRVEDEKFVQLIRVFLSEVEHNVSIRPLVMEVLHHAVGFVSNYLGAQMEQGRLQQSDPLLTAQLLIGTIMGFVLRRQVLHDPMALQYTHEQIVDTIVTTLLQGLLPR